MEKLIKLQYNSTGKTQRGENKLKKIGFTIGKFAPFHKGHEYLIETALKDVDDFYVVIYDTPQFDIDIDTKEKWVKEKFPGVKVIKAFDSPKQYGLDNESVNIQMKYLENEIKLINNYSKEEAIKELIKSKKLKEKIKHINDFIKGLNNDR